MASNKMADAARDTRLHDVTSPWNGEKELFDEFINETKEELDKCLDLLEQENHQEIVRIVHTIKGTGATIGAFGQFNHGGGHRICTACTA